MNGVLRHLRRLALPRDGDAPTDGQLLERFLNTRDDAAFETIVRRHGPMVLGVCRRVLPGVQDAEDAFQATFLVLVHKAATVAVREAVGSWLYGVAYRTACKARAAAARRRTKEMQMARPEAQSEPEDLWRELRPLLDQELSRLPEKYRAPVVLCDLQGQTRKQAAEQLGCPEGTVSGRLARARGMLAKRLAHRGVALSTAAFALALSRGTASAGVGMALVAATTRAATLVAAGHVPAGVISAPVAALTAGVLKSMGISKLKLVLVLLLTIGTIGVGWGVCSSGADDNPKAIQPLAAGVGGGGGGGAGIGGGVQDPVERARQRAEVPAAGGGGSGAAAAAQEKINLPTGPIPVQVLASIDGDGKLVIKRSLLTVSLPRFPAGGFPGGGFPGGAPVPPAAPGRLPNAPQPVIPPAPAGGAAPAPGLAAPDLPAVGGPGGPGLPAAPAAAVPAGGGAGIAAPGGPGGGGFGGGGFGGGVGAGRAPRAARLQTQTYDIDTVEVYDTKGKRLDSKDVMDRLKEETVALAIWAAPLDPLHLRVVKDGTLIFVLPNVGFPAPPGFAPGLNPGAGPGFGALPQAIQPPPVSR